MGADGAVGDGVYWIPAFAGMTEVTQSPVEGEGSLKKHDHRVGIDTGRA